MGGDLREGFKWKREDKRAEGVAEREGERVSVALRERWKDLDDVRSRNPGNLLDKEVEPKRAAQ